MLSSIEVITLIKELQEPIKMSRYSYTIDGARYKQIIGLLEELVTSRVELGRNPWMEK